MIWHLWVVWMVFYFSYLSRVRVIKVIVEAPNSFGLHRKMQSTASQDIKYLNVKMFILPFLIIKDKLRSGTNVHKVKLSSTHTHTCTYIYCFGRQMHLMTFNLFWYTLKLSLSLIRPFPQLHQQSAHSDSLLMETIKLGHIRRITSLWNP